MRDFADAQRCTRASAVAACIYQCLQSGGPSMALVPYGEPVAKKEGKS